MGRLWGLFRGRDLVTSGCGFLLFGSGFVSDGCGLLLSRCGFPSPVRKFVFQCHKLSCRKATPEVREWVCQIHGVIKKEKMKRSKNLKCPPFSEVYMYSTVVGIT